ncbi:hypothetical protein JCM11641_000133 [Rhodosporidiobolus odoratus]
MSSYSSATPTPYKPGSSSASPQDDDQATQRFVIGKIDAGIAVLISDSVHLIEFPSLLLPPGVGPGSIVNISCSRNVSAERAHAREFWDLQRDIFETFGAQEPSAPVLRVRNTTQTSVTLEWDKLELASASLISLSMYRNGQRLTTIPNPTTNTSTKLSGLQLDTDYSFHLVLKTSAGTFSSPIVKTRTHTIDNTSGVRVCFGLVEPSELLEQAKDAVKEMNASWDDRIQIDTTHFVATSNASRQNPTGGPGVEYQKAVQLSIPVVSPEWLLACHRSSKLVPISAYYLGTTNHAASLSSAQLVSTPSQQSVRRVAPAAAAPPPPPIVLEEPEAAPNPPPVRLEENVEGPPREEEEEVSPEEPPSSSPAEAEADGTDSSTKGVKAAPSDDEPSEEQALEAKPDAAGEELAAELEVTKLDDSTLAADEEKGAPVEAEVEEPLNQEGELDAPASELKQELEEQSSAAEAEGDTDTPKASMALDGSAVEEREAAVVEADEGEKKEKAEEEDEDAGETSLVDVKL